MRLKSRTRRSKNDYYTITPKKKRADCSCNRLMLLLNIQLAQPLSAIRRFPITRTYNPVGIFLLYAPWRYAACRVCCLHSQPFPYHLTNAHTDGTSELIPLGERIPHAFHPCRGRESQAALLISVPHPPELNAPDLHGFLFYPRWSCNAVCCPSARFPRASAYQSDTCLWHWCLQSVPAHQPSRERKCNADDFGFVTED